MGETTPDRHPRPVRPMLMRCHPGRLGNYRGLNLADGGAAQLIVRAPRICANLLPPSGPEWHEGGAGGQRPNPARLIQK